MLAFYSAKGGSGCSVVASAAAVLSSRLGPTLLVDLGGDLPAVFGLAESGNRPVAVGSRPTDLHSADLGLADWLAAESPLPDSLRRIERSISDTLSLLSLGVGVFDPRPDQSQLLARLLRTDGRRIVLDVGHGMGQGKGMGEGTGMGQGTRTGLAGGREAMLDASDRTVLVTRACYLAVRAAHRSLPPDQVVLITEPGRALSANDVAAAIGRPVAAVLRWDPAVARAVDAGVLRDRLPRSLRDLANVVGR